MIGLRGSKGWRGESKPRGGGEGETGSSGDEGSRGLIKREIRVILEFPRRLKGIIRIQERKIWEKKKRVGWEEVGCRVGERKRES